jgi:hypothetical protein
MSGPFTSPDVRNYFIGKGDVYVKEVGADDSTYVHIGNVPKFEFTPKPETKDHFSAMAGTKTLDAVAIVSKEGEVAIEAEEFTMPNLIIALLGEMNSDGSIEIMGASKIERTVQLRGTNDFGTKFEATLNRVFFIVNKALNLIDDNWGSLPLTGRVLRQGDAVTGSFGKIKPLP